MAEAQRTGSSTPTTSHQSKPDTSESRGDDADNATDSSAQSDGEAGDQGEGLRSGPWKMSEDALLVKVATKYGAKNWNKVACEIPGRSSKSCRLRWCNQLNPRINRAAFTEWEDAVIVRGQEEFGKKWALISKLLVGRTDNAVKNRWNGLFCRRLSVVIRSNAYLCAGGTLQTILKLGLQGSQSDSLMTAPDSGRSQDTTTRLRPRASPAKRRAPQTEGTSGTFSSLSHPYATAEDLLDTFSSHPNGYTAKGGARRAGGGGSSTPESSSFDRFEPAGLHKRYCGIGWVPATPFTSELGCLGNSGAADGAWTFSGDRC